MKKMNNSAVVAGRVYEFDLEVKQVKREDSANYGKDFIQGSVSVAVDDTGTNVVQVHYSYVAPTYKNGNPNSTYTVLKNLIDNEVSWLTNSKEEAPFIELKPTIALNDYYSVNRKEFVSFVRLEGGFARMLNKPQYENRFDADMIITQVIDKSEPEKEGEKGHLDIKGAVFSWNGSLLPVTFRIENEQGIKWVLNQDISPKEPMLIPIIGSVVNMTIVETKTEENVFGGEIVTQTESVKRAFMVNAMKSPYEFDDDNTITIEELKTAQENRNIYLAEVEKNAIEYQKNKTPEQSVFSSIPVSGDVTPLF